MGIRYGRVPEGSGEVEWHFVSHIECDGIGGFARLLRERGVETGKLPETKHRCRLVLVPLLRLWRESRRQGECAVRGDWLVPDQGAAGISEAVAWHLFTEEETREMVARCRERGVTVNSFLLKHLDQAVRPQVIRPEATLPWIVPVNLRRNIRQSDDTANHVSGVEVRIASDDTVDAIQSQILRRLKRGEHRANQLLIMIGGILSHADKVSYLRKDRVKPTGNIGAFSNLGVWDVGAFPGSGDGWLFCPHVVTGQLLGAGCVTFRGRLGLTVQGCPALSSTPEVAKEWMGRWVDGIRDGG
jgi:hypothetical protein